MGKRKLKNEELQKIFKEMSPETRKLFQKEAGRIVKEEIDKEMLKQLKEGAKKLRKKKKKKNGKHK